MSEIDRGPLAPYQITWRSGYVETVHAHQVLMPTALSSMLGVADPNSSRVMFHGEIDGRWQLLLVADTADILTIRRMWYEPAKPNAT